MRICAKSEGRIFTAFLSHKYFHLQRLLGVISEAFKDVLLTMINLCAENLCSIVLFNLLFSHKVDLPKL